MHNKGTPPHPGASGYPADEDDGMIYEDAALDFDEDDMIEILDDDENEGTDGGNFADDEEDGDVDYEGPGMEGFAGQQPDQILTSHSENAVFSCCFDSSGLRLLTGGEDDLANLWDISSIKTQSPMFKCLGHKESVVCVSFNWDSSYFSTGDLSGIVKVWKTSNQENVISFETGELSWSWWHSASNILFAGCHDGSIYMWKIPSGECKIYTGSSTNCECGVLLADGKRILAGYADGTLKLFDLKSGEVQHNFTKVITDHSPIICVVGHQTRQIIASGNGNGIVSICSSQTGKLLKSLQGFLPNGTEGADERSTQGESIEGLSFFCDSTIDCLVCGSVNGNVVVWDLSTMAERIRLVQEAGITKILWHPSLPLMYTAGLDGVIRVVDARTCKIEKLLGRHRTEILDLCISKDGNRLASASEDGTVFIFNNLIPIGSA